MRIHVTGNAGSGKTTFAGELGSTLGLPVFGLDKVVWQSGWKKTAPAVRAAAEQKLINQPDWVIEGVSPRVRAAADLVIFLDTSPLRCLWRALARSVPYLFRSRPELPQGCPELLILPRLVRIIAAFPKRVRPVLLAEAREGRYRVIRNDRERHRILQGLRGKTRAD